MKTIPPEKIGVFLDEARKSGVLEMYCFELATGLRRGELFGLKWSDIDFSTGSIFIQRQVQRIEGKVVETSLKTKNAYRSVMVSKEILDMLTQMRERTVVKSEYVFPSPTGGILGPGSQRKLLQRVLKRAGLSRRPSGLRKTILLYNSLAHRTTWLRSDLASSRNTPIFSGGMVFISRCSFGGN